MKFRSILSFSPELRTNAINYLLFGILFSLQSSTSSVRILPNEKIKAIWNSQTLFVTCEKTGSQTGGVLKWFSQSGEVDDNSRAPVYVQESANSIKLFLMNTPKKHSGTYECRQILDGKTISSDKFELKVFNSINMLVNKDTHVGFEGQAFSMPCLAKFDDDASEATLSWSHNNLPIKNREGAFAITNTATQERTHRNVKSILNIRHLTKEHEGIYVCEAVYANAYLTDIKTIDINLRVQFAPRFPPNTQKNVWISNSTGPVVVNVTCLVNADPVAKFEWLMGHGIPVDARSLKGIKHTIHSTENLSILTLEYNDVNQIRSNLRGPEGLQRKFKCKASNSIGVQDMTFELNIGQLPQPPILDKYSYQNGILVLSVNETEVEPPIDIYRLDIDNNHQIYFNASNRDPLANNTYQVTVDVPHGTHELIIYAHNPVGWSESNTPNLPLRLVINSGSVPDQYLALLMALIMGSVYAF